MMQMNHEELANRLEKRLDNIETKLDRYLEKMAENSTDVNWVKGYIKITLTTLTAMAVGVITTIIHVFFK